MSFKITVLSGGVGGARLAKSLATLDETEVTVVVNVGDDERVYGLGVSPDLDTLLYTLAGIEGPEGWGVHKDTWTTMERLSGLGLDTAFRIGDRDLATNLYRTARLGSGDPLSSIISSLAERLDVEMNLLPATDDPLRTRVLTDSGDWLPFQEYFVIRRHVDEVKDVRFDGAGSASPAPGVIEAIVGANVVVIAPSNPPLSIWPILAVPDISAAVNDAARVLAISPLFGGAALKGPADRVLASLGYSPGNTGIAEAYDGVVHDLVIDSGDRQDKPALEESGLRVHSMNTHLQGRWRSRRFARLLRKLL